LAGRSRTPIQLSKLDGKAWQAFWSGTGTAAATWVPGIDNLERHFLYVQQWLVAGNRAVSPMTTLSLTAISTGRFREHLFPGDGKRLPWLRYVDGRDAVRVAPARARGASGTHAICTPGRPT